MLTACVTQGAASGGSGFSELVLSGVLRDVHTRHGARSTVNDHGARMEKLRWRVGVIYHPSILHCLNKFRVIKLQGFKTNELRGSARSWHRNFVG